MAPAAPPAHWLQTSIRWSGTADAERKLAKHLGPQMQSAVDDEMLKSWFFIRKSPWWRLRYTPAPDIPLERARQRVNDFLTGLRTDSHLAEFVHQIYEPETTAFGGVTAMDLAHRLFARDTTCIADYLTLTAHPSGRDRRRELSLLLCTALIQAAGQEWYETGDIWARLAVLRGGKPAHIPARHDEAAATVRRFLITDPQKAAARLEGPQAELALNWIAAFRTAGTELRSLADQGRLDRGLRSVLAHHILFHWNRLGLPLTDQQRLARAARDAVFADQHTNRLSDSIGQEGTHRHD